MPFVYEHYPPLQTPLNSFASNARVNIVRLSTRVPISLQPCGPRAKACCLFLNHHTLLWSGRIGAYLAWAESDKRARRGPTLYSVFFFSFLFFSFLCFSSPGLATQLLESIDCDFTILRAGQYEAGDLLLVHYGT